MDASVVDSLIKEEKLAVDFQLPKKNVKTQMELIGKTGKFVFDYQVGEIGKFVLSLKEMSETKQKYQTRFNSQFLIRVDVNASPHMCNDGKMYKNHIHIYRGDDNNGNPIVDVYNLDEYDFTHFQNLTSWNILFDFFEICNIKIPDGVVIQEAI